MSYPGERVGGEIFELPPGYLVSWDRMNNGCGIRWSLWWGDERVAHFELGDALGRMGSYGKDARQMFTSLAAEHQGRLLAAPGLPAAPGPALLSEGRASGVASPRLLGDVPAAADQAGVGAPIKPALGDDAAGHGLSAVARLPKAGGLGVHGDEGQAGRLGGALGERAVDDVAIKHLPPAAPTWAAKYLRRPAVVLQDMVHHALMRVKVLLFAPDAHAFAWWRRLWRRDKKAAKPEG